MIEFDIIVIGAGPAGMSAARCGAEFGTNVLLIDDQASGGGQVYRNVEHASSEQCMILGPDYEVGLGLIRSLEHIDITIEQSATVWRVDTDGTVTYSIKSDAKQAKGRHLIIATGALERPTPVPGWTLPGAMTVGAAQIMLKSSGVAPQNAVLTGSGPLLYLFAHQLIEAGVPPKALIETQTLKNVLSAVRYLPGAVRTPSYLKKGWGMLKAIKRAGVPRFVGATDIAIKGEGSVSGVSFVRAGRRNDIPCETILLHSGVVPNIQMTQSLRLEHEWDEAQRCFKPKCNIVGVTSNPKISVAGDGAGISGAKAAAIGGELAALGALEKLKLIETQAIEPKRNSLLQARSKELAIRPFLDALYRVPNEILRPNDEVMICRCEEVTAGNIRRYAQLGCTGPNQTKALGRPGMGPCQGRFCGLTVTELLAEANDAHPDDVGYFRIRSPLKPVSLGEVATLADENN
jgi:thioredoxin reductase